MHPAAKQGNVRGLPRSKQKEKRILSDEAIPVSEEWKKKCLELSKLPKADLLPFAHSLIELVKAPSHRQQLPLLRPIEGFLRSQNCEDQIDVSKHSKQLELLVGLVLELYFADLDGALYGPLLSIADLFSRNQKTRTIFLSLAEHRANQFFTSELRDRSHLTVTKGLMETACFASIVSKHTTSVMQYFESMMRDLSVKFSAPPGSVPLSEPIVECEFAAKILGSFVQCTQLALRPLLLDHSKQQTHHGDDPHSNSLRSVARDTLRHMLVLMQSDQSPCNCIAPLGIAFVSLFELHCTSLEDIIAAFFSDLSSAATPRPLIDQLLNLSVPFSKAFAQLAPISQVSLHRGVLIVVPTKQLLQKIHLPQSNKEGTLLLGGIFPRLCDACENSVHCDSWSRASVYQALQTLTSTLKDLIAANHSKATDKYLLMSFSEFFGSVLRKVLSLILSSWEDQNEGVVTNTRVLFKDLIDLYQILGEGISCAPAKSTKPSAPTTGTALLQSSPFIEELFDSVLPLEWFQKAKCGTLQILIGTYGTKVVMRKNPKFVEEMLTAMGELSVRNAVGKLLEIFLKALRTEAIEELKNKPSSSSSSLTESDASSKKKKADEEADEQRITERCMTVWLQPLVQGLVRSESKVQDGLLTYALSPLLQLHPLALSPLLRAIAATPSADGRALDRLQMWAVLATLRTARQLGIIDGVSLQIVTRGAISVPLVELLQVSLVHYDEELRNVALELLCISLKTGEEPTRLEFDMIRHFLDFGLKSASAGFRQRVVLRLRRFLMRLKESARKKYGGKMRKSEKDRLEKKKQRVEESNQQGLPEDRDEGVKAVASYLRTIVHKLLAGLYPGAPFQRKMSPLELLSTVIDIWGPNASDGLPVSDLLTTEAERRMLGLFSVPTTRLVVGTLWDNFDLCRQQAYAIVKRSPLPLYGIDSVEAFQPLLNRAVRLVSSVRAREAETGALILRLALLYMSRFPHWTPKLSLASATSVTRVTESALKSAADSKEQGNAHYKAGKWKEAAESYSRAISFAPSAVLHSNRALCEIKLQNWKQAEEDCTSALLLDPSNVKALGRRAQAREALHKYSEALDDAECGLRMEPTNKELQELTIVLQVAAKSSVKKDATQKLSTSSRALVMLRQLLSLLDEHIAMAKTSLANASQRGPMHGVLLALRFLLDEIDFGAVPESEIDGWRSFVADVVARVKIVSEVVLTVVGDVAPEGYKSAMGPSYRNTANDGGEDDENDLDDDLAAANTSSAPSSSPSSSSDLYLGSKGQIMLVCCWVAIKEVSMLLGTILARMPLPDPLRPPEKTFLSVSQVREFGEMLMQILLSTMHNGAVEGASMGFQVLCEVLLKSTHPELYSQPKQWLEQLLDRIEQDTFSEELILTRRSSGLPFCFIAILRAELALENRVLQLIPMSFKRLLQIASQSNRSAIHALNVLKAIIQSVGQESTLGPFLSEAFVICIKGYSSDNWSVRNSSTITFSAIMDRMLGMKKGSRNAKSHLTSNQFFARYPTLHPFLLTELARETQIALRSITNNNSTSEKAAENNTASSEKKVLYSSLYPIMVLMARFLPPQFSAQTLSAADFIPFVSSCCNHYNFKVRDMAARALVPLIPLANTISFIRALVKALPLTKDQFAQTNSNSIHGCLLQIRYLIKSYLETKPLVEDLASVLIPELESIQWLFEVNLPPANLVLFDSLAAVALYEPKSKQLAQFRANVYRVGLAIVKDITGSRSHPVVVMDSLCREAAARYLAHSSLLLEQSNSAATALLSDLVKHSDYEVRYAALKQLTARMRDTKSHSAMSESVLDIAAIHSLALDRLFVESYRRCTGQLLKLLRLAARPLPVNEVLQPENAKEGAAGPLWSLLMSFVTESASKAAFEALRFTGFLLRQLLDVAPRSALVLARIPQWVALMDKHTQPETPVDFRAAALDSIVAANLHGQPIVRDVFPQQSIVDSWFIVIRLLQDDEESIREAAAEYVCAVARNTQKANAGDPSRVRLFATSMDTSAALEFAFDYTHEHLETSPLLDTLLRQFESALRTNVFHKADWSPITELFEHETDNFWAEQQTVLQLSAHHCRRLLRSQLRKLSTEQQNRIRAFRRDVYSQLESAHQWITAIESKFAHLWTAEMSFRQETFESLSRLINAAFAVTLRLGDEQLHADSQEALSLSRALNLLSTLHLHPLLQHALAYLAHESAKAFSLQNLPKFSLVEDLSPLYLTSKGL